jgi:hypothetical protein
LIKQAERVVEGEKETEEAEENEEMEDMDGETIYEVEEEIEA